MTTLRAIERDIRAHRGCGFEPCETATHPVPGEGNPKAAVMLVGEAPGAHEDAEGRPFVGRAGQLLDELLAEAGLARDGVYITNVLKHDGRRLYPTFHPSAGLRTPAVRALLCDDFARLPDTLQHS